MIWSLETLGGVSGGSPWGDQSVEPGSDSDGNGYANILLGTAWGGRTAYGLDGLDGSAVRALNGATGVEIWRSTQVLDNAIMVDVLEDINGDGLSEFIPSNNP